MYNPPPKVIDKRLLEIVNRNSNNVVIIGDLNSPHTSFGSRITTESGIRQYRTREYISTGKSHFAQRP